MVTFMTASYTRNILKSYALKIDECQRTLDECKAAMLKLEIECGHTEDDGKPAYDTNKPPHYRLCSVCGFPPNK